MTEATAHPRHLRPLTALLLLHLVFAAGALADTPPPSRPSTAPT